MRSSWVGLAFAVACGCSSPKPGQFPTRSELGDIAERPVPPNLFPKAGSGDESWTLAGPLAESLEIKEYAGAEPIDAVLRDAAARRPLVASVALHCVATEIARYQGDHGAGPSDSVIRFVTGRCGATRSAVGTSTLALPVGAADDAASTQRLLAEAARVLAGVLGKSGSGSSGDVAGLALVRGAKQIVLAAVAQPRNVDVEPVPFVPVDGKVTLRGRVLFQADTVSGYVTRGAFGYGECTPKEGVPLPAFELTCEVAPIDDFAWIEIVAVPPGRILGHVLLETLVFPKGAPTPTFTPPPRDPAAGLPTAHAIVDALNARRAQAGIGPVQLDLPESGVVSKLAPHYFAAARGLVEEVIADKVILGVKAGWDVDGTVRLGESAALVVEGARGPNAIVDAILESPVKRASLFDPEMRRVAVGLVSDPASHGLGVLFGSYALVEPARRNEDAARLVARITKLRAARGLPPPGIDPAVGPALAKAAAAFESSSDGDALLKEAMDSAVRIAHVAVRGMVLQASSIDKIPLPPALLNEPDLRLGLAVGHHKSDDSPWATLSVFLLVEGRGASPAP